MWMWSEKTPEDSNQSKIKVVRIKYGEEIITECIENEKGLFIEEAASILKMNNGKLVLATWMPHTTIQNGFFLSKDVYLFTADPEEEMLKYYEKWRSSPFGENDSQDITT